MSIKTWYSEHSDGVILHLYIAPSSSKNQIVGLFQDRLKIKIAAPPVEGEANAEVISFLKKVLHVNKKQIEIVRGETSKQKDVKIEGIKLKDLLSYIAL